MTSGGPVAGEPLPALERCGSVVDTFMHETFSKIGLKVGLNPWKTVWISLLGAFCCMSGFSVLRVETRPENLWMPTGTEASDEAMNELRTRFAAKERAIEHDIDHSVHTFTAAYDMSYNFLSQ